jgi:hypothetical protein
VARHLLTATTAIGLDPGSTTLWCITEPSSLKVSLTHRSPTGGPLTTGSLEMIEGSAIRWTLLREPE